MATDVKKDGEGTDERCVWRTAVNQLNDGRIG